MFLENSTVAVKNKGIQTMNHHYCFCKREGMSRDQHGTCQFEFPCELLKNSNCMIGFLGMLTV